MESLVSDIPAGGGKTADLFTVKRRDSALRDPVSEELNEKNYIFRTCHDLQKF